MSVDNSSAELDVFSFYVKRIKLVDYEDIYYPVIGADVTGESVCG